MRHTARRQQMDKQQQSHSGNHSVPKAPLLRLPQQIQYLCLFDPQQHSTCRIILLPSCLPRNPATPPPTPSPLSTATSLTQHTTKAEQKPHVRETQGLVLLRAGMGHVRRCHWLRLHSMPTAAAACAVPPGGVKCPAVCASGCGVCAYRLHQA